MEYNKLVRDKIPNIIEEGGEIAHVRVLDVEEYRSALLRKLDEEVSEYHESLKLEELADILEVVLALAEAGGASREELVIEYQKKHEARGGFEKKIFLISKE